MSEITDRAAKLNRDAWNSFRRQRDEGKVDIRIDAAAELLAALAAGEDLLALEIRPLIGDIELKGKRLLDMGCGDGAEMLVWALEGVDVVGVDNSPKQLEAAQRNADKLRDAGKLTTSCRLIQADLLQLDSDLLCGEFDIVYSSWVTGWIGDLDKWFRSVFLALKPGGLFLLITGHPVAPLISGQKKRYTFEGPIIEGPSDAPSDWNPDGDPITTIEWWYRLGTLVTAIAQSGLRITRLIEDVGIDDPHGELFLTAVKDL